LAKPIPAFFEGEYVHELTARILQSFLQRLPVVTKTERHYREVLHHFFEYCIKFGLFHPTNWHCPNPVAALPSYVVRNRQISFLTPDDINQQLAILEGEPAFKMAAQIMIYAGLRRSEALWLTRDAIANDLSYLSVVNRRDEDEVESSLKTGERAVTICRRFVQRSSRTCRSSTASGSSRIRMGAGGVRIASPTSSGRSPRPRG
jgi:site-specific recombinase XerD